MRRSSASAERRALLRHHLADERGSASVEFLTVGLLLLVPLIYLVLALGQIQHAVLGVEGAARHAARTIAQAPTHADGLAAADRAIAVAASDAGLARDSVSVVIRCAPNPSSCTTPRGTVTVQIDASVPLPFAPPELDLDVGLAVPVAAQAQHPVSAFRSAP